jgi:deazaflavin-dependent oxidoreductase (nitroreductase family)
MGHEGGLSMKEALLVRITTGKLFTWILARLASRVDPVLFKATNGRLTMFGPTAFPMVTITMVGRKSGKERSVHLAAVEDGGDQLIVASSMGRENHPGWRYNLEANPLVDVQSEGETYKARAEVLCDEDKDKVWGKIRESIPQMRVYETRTDRNIRVFRLRRI